MLGEGRGPETYFVCSSCGPVRIPEQRNTPHKDEMLVFMLPLELREVFHLYRYANVGTQDWGAGGGRGERKENSACDSCCATTHQEFLRTLGMATIRFEGGAKEQE